MAEETFQEQIESAAKAVDAKWETMELVRAALTVAATKGLEIEVITDALIFLKENPDVCISNALVHGLLEWDFSLLPTPDFKK